VSASERDQNARRLAEMKRQLERTRSAHWGPLKKRIAETEHAITAADRKKGKKP
jgi:hypothetical protein